MTQSTDNPRRTLGHLKRLTREGQELLDNRPLDELAHAKWIMRTMNYLARKMPEVQVLPLHQLISLEMPNTLDPGYKRPHPLDAAMRRNDQGQQIIQKLLAVLASARERLELQLETDGN